MANKPTQQEGSSKDGSVVEAPPKPSSAPQATAASQKPLEIPSTLTVRDLASLMGADPIEVIKMLMRHGLMRTINDAIEQETAILIAHSLGVPAQPADQKQRGPGSLVVSLDEEDPAQLESRAPVVTILGHVDHGKTTLLDAIRNTNTVAQEAGGITQRIGAYQVNFEGHAITFLDTPGHEAFTAMRARGAQVTDVAILVVAADDGVMPQTVEAIAHVKAARVPLIAAINKTDRPEADQEKVKRQLSERDLLVEEWGGDVIAVPVSALKGEGVSDLLKSILVVAEVGEFKANPHREAKGVVVEARIDKSKGPVATVLVQTGTLGVGDQVVAGEVRGRVRAMLNDRGDRIKLAGPSVPAEILGLNGLPQAGDTFTVAPDEKTARTMVEDRQLERQSQRGLPGAVTLEEIHSRIESGEVKALDLIVKTDTQGSIDAVLRALEQLNTEQFRINLIHAASGSITESDTLLAVASKAIIIGFNSRPEPGARALAQQEGIEIRFYDIIYRLTDDVQNALKGLLAPEVRDVIEGYATVRAVFGLGRRLKAAGIYVNEGHIRRGTEIHVMRNNKRLFLGPMTSLKHFKDDVRELSTGLEGGIILEGFQDYAEGDILEAHATQQAD